MGLGGLAAPPPDGLATESGAAAMARPGEWYWTLRLVADPGPGTIETPAPHIDAKAG